MKTFKVTITRIDEPLYDDDALSLIVPGIDGEVTILADHEPFITPAKAGIVRLKTNSEEKIFSIESGILEVGGNRATLLL